MNVLKAVVTPKQKNSNVLLSNGSIKFRLKYLNECLMYENIRCKI